MRLGIALMLALCFLESGCTSCKQASNESNSLAASAPENKALDGWLSRLLASPTARPDGTVPDPNSLPRLLDEATAALKARAFDRAIELYKNILRTWPEDENALYNLACAQALAGQTLPALDTLERAVRAGFDNANCLDSDTDLVSLRKQDRYQALLRELRNRTDTEITWLANVPNALVYARREAACVFLLFSNKTTAADQQFKAQTLANPDVRARLKDFAAVTINPAKCPALAGVSGPATPAVVVLDPQGRMLGTVDTRLSPRDFARRLGELSAGRPIDDPSSTTLPPEVRRKLAQKHFPGMDPQDPRIDAAVEILRLPPGILQAIGEWSWPRRNLHEFGVNKIFLLAHTPDGKARTILFRAGEWRKDQELTLERERVLRRLYAREALTAPEDPCLTQWKARKDLDSRIVLDTCLKACAGRADLPLDAETIERARKNLSVARDGGRELAAALGALSQSAYGAECAWAGVWLVSRMDRMSFMRTSRSRNLSDLECMDARMFFENVFYAVKARRTFPWGMAVKPADFLQFVLPPRGTQEPLQRWRRLFFEALEPEVRTSRLQDPQKAAEFAAACCYDVYQYEGATPWEDFGMLSALGTHEGRCEDCANVEIAMIRAIGIPAAQEYVPWWGRGDGNHAWRTLPGITPKSKSCGNAKVFLATWDGPRDVTDRHADRLATLTFPTTQPDGTSAKLACWNSGDWRTLDRGKVSGNRITFQNVGCEEEVALNVRVSGEPDRVLILTRDGKTIPIRCVESAEPSTQTDTFEAPKSGVLGEFDAGQTYRLLVLAAGVWKEAPCQRASTGTIAFRADADRLYRIEGAGITGRPFRIVPAADGSGLNAVKY